MERDLWGRLAAFEKPLIAAIHGYALGAGCELGLLCDFRIACDDARFGLPETHLGYVPTAGGSQTLPRTVGLTRALDMILTAEPIDARRALDYGIAPRRRAQARPRSRRRGSRPPPHQRCRRPTLRLAKRSMRDGADLPLTDAIRLERRLAMRNVTT